MGGLNPRRLRACVEAWPEAETGAYDPRCCRFPKSCSADIYDPAYVSEEQLEPALPERPSRPHSSLLAAQETPEEGHTWRITYEARGSYSVGEDPTHHDSADFDGLTHTIEVRAWSLSAALRKAADLPFPTLMNETCWCGGAVGVREPGDAYGLGCLADINHDWRQDS